MSLPKHAKYKESRIPWLGAVPSHWEVTKIKTVIRRIDSGVSVNAIDMPADNGCIGVLKTSCVYDGTFRFNENKLVLEEELDRVACPVEKGTIIVSRMNTPALVGAAGLVEKSWPNLFLPDRLWQVHFKNCHPRFVHYWTLSHIYRTQVQNACSGTSSSMQNLGQDQFKSFWISLPNEGEQHAIANFLERETNKIDALIAEQEKLLTLLAEKRQATITHAVSRGLNPNVLTKDSGTSWLGNIPAHWDVRTISSISTKITNGYVGPTRDILVDEGVRYLQSLHIKENVIRFDTPYYVSTEWSKAHSKSILKAGDVLIVQTGDVGQTAVVTKEFEGCNCHALIIVAPKHDKIAGQWLSWVLNSDYGFHSLRSIQTGALHPHLNCGNVKNLLIPAPPMMEQLQIIKYVEEKLGTFEALSIEAKRVITLLKERRSALIAAAVTGKIDVRNAAPKASAA